MGSLVAVEKITTHAVESNSRVRKIQWDFFVSFAMPQPAIG
jgi:hypothetical protein